MNLFGVNLINFRNINFIPYVNISLQISSKSRDSKEEILATLRNIDGVERLPNEEDVFVDVIFFVFLFFP